MTRIFTCSVRSNSLSLSVSADSGTKALSPMHVPYNPCDTVHRVGSKVLLWGRVLVLQDPREPGQSREEKTGRQWHLSECTVLLWRHLELLLSLTSKFCFHLGHCIKWYRMSHTTFIDLYSFKIKVLTSLFFLFYFFFWHFSFTVKHLWCACVFVAGHLWDWSLPVLSGGLLSGDYDMLKPSTVWFPSAPSDLKDGTIPLLEGVFPILLTRYILYAYSLYRSVYVYT